MDNEKLFELMTKMYSDMNAKFEKIDKRFDNLEGRFDNLEGRFDNLEGRFDNLEIKVDKNTNAITALESELKDTKNTLFDGYKQTYEKLTELEGSVKDLAEKVESQDVKIEVIKGIKKRA